MSDQDATPQEQEQPQDIPPTRIVEAERRRPGFDADTGVWITLDDGQEWCFPKPRVRLHYAGARVGYVRRAAFPGRPTFDAEFGRLLGAATDADQIAPLSIPELMGRRLGLAAYMLRRHYDLADDELAALLSVNPYAADPADNAAYDAWMAVALGADAPKATGGGPGSGTG